MKMEITPATKTPLFPVSINAKRKINSSITSFVLIFLFVNILRTTSMIEKTRIPATSCGAYSRPKYLPPL